MPSGVFRGVLYGGLPSGSSKIFFVFSIFFYSATSSTEKCKTSFTVLHNCLASAIHCQHSSKKVEFYLVGRDVYLYSLVPSPYNYNALNFLIWYSDLDCGTNRKNRG